MTGFEKVTFVEGFSLQRSDMSIEHDSSSRLHSRGVQCRVLLGNRSSIMIFVCGVESGKPYEYWILGV